MAIDGRKAKRIVKVSLLGVAIVAVLLTHSYLVLVQN
jgi:hypothetical protein